MSYLGPFEKPSTLLRLGMAFLIVALVGQRFVHPTPGFGEDAIDALRGLCFGLSFGFNIWFVRRSSRSRCRPS